MRLVLPAIVLSAGCSAPAPQPSFEHPHPGARRAAISRAVEAGDRSVVPSLVELLDSQDGAVRLMAITGLERLTGETFGYRPDDPKALRDTAIARWVDFVAETPSDSETTLQKSSRAVEELDRESRVVIRDPRCER